MKEDQKLDFQLLAKILNILKIFSKYSGNNHKIIYTSKEIQRSHKSTVEQ